LAQIMPMVGSINSIFVGHIFMRFGCDYDGPNTPDYQLLTTMLTKARILDIQ
jgi:hypothetical protein